MSKSTKRELRSTRDAFGETLLDLAKENSKIVVISADLAESTRILPFAKKYPERFIEVGVAEQNMASVAAGLSFTGKIPVMASFGVFSPGRNWDQIRVSICYNDANVKMFATHTGLSADRDGATHQSLEDIAIMRALPNVKILSPCDFWEAKRAVKAAFEIEGPVYVRLSRAKTEVITTPQHSFKIGKMRIMEKGEKIALVGTGTIVSDGLNAAQEINKKHPNTVRVINCPTIKPFNIKDLLKSLGGIRKIITIEEHQIDAGFGSLICEMLSEEREKYLISRVGMNNEFGESGSFEELKKKYRMDKEGIKKIILDKIKNE